MAQTMIVAGGTWIALRKLRSIQATPAANLKELGYVSHRLTAFHPKRRIDITGRLSPLKFLSMSMSTSLFIPVYVDYRQQPLW